MYLSRLHSCPQLPVLYILISFLAEHVSAKRSGDSSPITPNSPSPSSSSGSSSFSLDPVNAAIFSFCIIFSLITALQAASAGLNIPKHVPFLSHNSTPTAFTFPNPATLNPLYAVGPIFPIALFLATFSLFVTYILRAVFWGLMFNNSPNAPVFSNPEDYLTALAVFSYFTNTFLAMSLFSFVCFRVRRLCYCTCRGKLHIVKRVFDMVLVGTLFVMGTVYVGHRGRVISAAKAQAGMTSDGSDSSWILNVDPMELERSEQLKRAHMVLMLLASFEVFVSAVMLYRHAGKYQSVPDRKVAIYIGSVIAPLFLFYNLFTLISQELSIVQVNAHIPGANLGAAFQLYNAGLLTSNRGSTLTTVEWDLGRTIVTCATLVVIIGMLLRFSEASLVDAIQERRQSVKARKAQEHNGLGVVYVHTTHGLTYKV